MDKLTFAWIIFSLYVLVTVALAIRGMMKTRDMAGFALGNRDMGPLLVGVTLAASCPSVWSRTLAMAVSIVAKRVCPFASEPIPTLPMAQASDL